MLSLIAHAEIDGSSVSVERALYVRASIESRLPSGRAVNAFQAYELGPMRAAASSGAAVGARPSRGGGRVCSRSTLLAIGLGGRPGRRGARPFGGRCSGPPRSPSSRTSGFARVPLVVVGSEGRVEVEAVDRDGTVVAAREVRLPIVPGRHRGRGHLVIDGRIRVAWEQIGEPKTGARGRLRGGVGGCMRSPCLQTMHNCRLSAPAFGGFKYGPTSSRTTRRAWRTRWSPIRKVPADLAKQPTPS